MTKVEQAWNKVAKSIAQTAEFLETFQKLHKELDATAMEQLQTRSQELFSSSIMQSTPDHFMEDIMGYAMRNGGLDFLIIEEPPKPVEKDEDEDEE